MQTFEHSPEHRASLSSAAQLVGFASDAGGEVALAGGRPIPPKLYRIGEVVDYSGLSRQTIHNYTTMGLLHESRWTRGGHRLYDESVFARLDHITRMKQLQKTMQEIRQFFAQADTQAV